MHGILKIYENHSTFPSDSHQPIFQSEKRLSSAEKQATVKALLKLIYTASERREEVASSGLQLTASLRTLQDVQQSFAQPSASLVGIAQGIANEDRESGDWPFSENMRIASVYPGRSDIAVEGGQWRTVIDFKDVCWEDYFREEQSIATDPFADDFVLKEEEAGSEHDTSVSECSEAGDANPCDDDNQIVD